MRIQANRAGTDGSGPRLRPKRIRRWRAGLRGLAVAACVSLVPIGVRTPPAAGLESPFECLIGAAVCAGLELHGGGGTSATDLPAPATRPVLVWQRLFQGLCVTYSGPGPLVGPGYTYAALGPGVLGADPGTFVLYLQSDVEPLPGTVILGSFVFEYAFPTIDGVAPVIVARCLRGDDPAPPDPPSASQIWERVPLPWPVPQASPPGTLAHPGVTGLTTFLWATAPAPVVAQVVLDGWVATAVAFPVRYTWATGDGTEVASGAPGAPTSPRLARYERRGDFWLTLHVTWRGVYSVDNPSWGVHVPEQDLGFVTVPGSRRYHVQEIRSVLVTPR